MTIRWYQGPLVGFDLETTSADPETARPVAFSFVLHDPTHAAPFRVDRSLVDPGIPIPKEASDIHGITDAMVEGAMECDEAIRFIVGKLIRLTAVEGLTVVGMNLSFDFTILDRQCERIGFPGLQDFTGPLLDIRVLDQKVDRYRPGKRTLSAMAHHYEILVPEGESAHDAATDATLSILIAREMAKRFKELRFQTPEVLHAKQIKWRHDQQEHFSEYRVEHGDDPIPQHEWAWPIFDTATPLDDRPV